MSLAQGGKIRRKPWVIRSNYIRHIDRDYFLDENDKQYSLSREDMISSDWELYEEKSKTYSFLDAIMALEKGKNIKRFNDDGSYKFIAPWNKNGENLFSYDDVRALNWIIEE